MKWHLQILRTTWVRWGYGPRGRYGKSMHCGRAVIHHDDLTFEFELPKPLRTLPAPQEHDRLIGYGWRWNTEDGTAGHPWGGGEDVLGVYAHALPAVLGRVEAFRVTLGKALTDVRMVDELAGGAS